MPDVFYNVSFKVNWIRPVCTNNQPYKWGANIPGTKDAIWGQKNLIYRWIRNSDQAVAYIGKCETPLTSRIKQYIKPGPTQEINKKVNTEQQNLALAPKKDFLFLEYTDKVPGYNLSLKRELLLAEALLIALSRPYLQ